MKKLFGKVFAILSALAIAFAFTACSAPPEQIVTLELSPAVVTVEIGKTATITAAVSGSDVAPEFKSDDPGIATVIGSGNTATVTAVAAGTTAVTAKIGGITASCTVAVTAPEPDPVKITLSKTEASVEKGKTLSVTVTVENSDAVPEFNSSDTSVAVVANIRNTATVSAIGVGKATITASIGDASAACVVTVTAPAIKPPAATEFTLGGIEKLVFSVGQKFDIAGMTVTAKFDNGSKRVLDASEYTVSPAVGSPITGKTKLIVSYGGATASRDISIYSPALKTESQIKSEFTANKKSGVYNGYRINYCLRTPDRTATKFDPAPLVLFMHGAGERGSNNESQLKNSILKAFASEDSGFYNSYVIAPQCPYRATEDGADVEDGNFMNSDYTKWVNTAWSNGCYNLSEVKETKALATVANIVKEYAARPEVDASRIYVVGLSMGGYATWDLLARHADLFAAGVPMCGAGPIDCASALADMPIYAFHGDKDTSVPFAAGTQAMYNAVKAQNKNKMIFKPMPGEGHGIWDNVWNIAPDNADDAEGIPCPRIIDWLFAQSKSSASV